MPYDLFLTSSPYDVYPEMCECGADNDLPCPIHDEEIFGDGAEDAYLGIHDDDLASDVA